jgi:phage terminase small subunit
MLTPLQKRFVAELLITPGNASAAYVRAGGKTKNPDVMAAKMLAQPEVAAAVSKAQEKVFDDLDVSSHFVLKGLRDRASANLLDFVRVVDGNLVPDLSKMTREQAVAIQEFTVDHTGGTGDGERVMYFRTRVKLVDQLRALELLGKHLKLFVDRIEMKVDGDLSNEVLTARNILRRTSQDDREREA